MEKKFTTVLNTEQQQQKHLPEFVILQVFCEVNFQFWFMNLTKEKKGLNQGKKGDIFLPRTESVHVLQFTNIIELTIKQVCIHLPHNNHPWVQ